MSRHLPWMAIAALAACTVATDPRTGEAVQSIVPDPTCDDFICGGNSPTIGDGVIFDELNSDEADWITSRAGALVGAEASRTGADRNPRAGEAKVRRRARRPLRSPAHGQPAHRRARGRASPR